MRYELILNYGFWLRDTEPMLLIDGIINIMRKL